MIETTAALLIFLLPLAYSPGPGNMVFAANGARFGFWAVLPASLGYHLATWLVTVLFGLGFLTTFAHSPGLFHALRIAGALYVFWLAWGLYRASPGGRETSLTQQAAPSSAARPISFMDGAVLLLLNPKAYVIILLMFSQFLDEGEAEVLPLIILVTSVFTLNNFVAFSLWTLVGAGLAALFRHKRNAERVNKSFGVILAMVAFWVLVS